MRDAPQSRAASLPHALRLPYPGYLAVVVRRSAVTWLLVRLFCFIVLGVILSDFSASVRQPTWGVPALLVWLDRRRFHELLLHANLGASELWFWAASLATVFALDTAAAIVLRPF
ncbi:MAG TPA: hypothetical protein VFL93_03095 [Longimicrobiaceae bacterium]|nr:hypothetical protein [Longimicrobiaceae bacterium]